MSLAKGCQRSHPHDEMNEVCELKTEIASLANENANLKHRLEVMLRRKNYMELLYRGYTVDEADKLLYAKEG